LNTLKYNGNHECHLRHDFISFGSENEVRLFFVKQVGTNF